MGHSDQERTFPAHRSRCSGPGHPQRLLQRWSPQRRRFVVLEEPRQVRTAHQHRLPATSEHELRSHPMLRQRLGKRRFRQGRKVPGDPQEDSTASGSIQQMPRRAEKDATWQALQLAQQLHLRWRGTRKGYLQRLVADKSKIFGYLPKILFNFVNMIGI